MGGACCVASRDRNIQHGSSGEFLQRNFRHSPSWSFRWDSRVGIAGEEPSLGWLSDIASRNDIMDAKSATDVSAQVSDGGSSMESYRTGVCRKSPINHEITKNQKMTSSDQSTARSTCTEVKQYTESPQVSDSASVKLSPSIHTTSLHMSPISSQSYPPPPSPTPSSWAQGSPAQQLAHGHQVSDSHSSGRNSPMNSVYEEGQVPYGNSVARNLSTRGSYGRPSDGWSAHVFTELMSASQRERWSFDSDSCSLSHDKLSRSGHNSRSISVDLQICGICSKPLSEKSAWSSHKIVANNELSVVAVLICGHVYHSECLETITPEINKYDPACPVCTFGEKQTLKLTGKMLKAEKDLKARNSKKSSRVVDTSASFDFDYWKKSAVVPEGKSPNFGNSSSLKISAAKPFLKRHFSFGSRSNKSSLESPSVRKKGLFWARSSRE